MYFTFLISTIVISILTINILKLYLNDMNIITVFTSNKEGILFEILTIPFISVIDALVTKNIQILKMKTIIILIEFSLIVTVFMNMKM